MRRLGLVLWLSWASAAGALELDLPSNARETASVTTAPGRYFAPTGTFNEGQLPGVQIEGEVRRSAFRIGAANLTPLQILQPLRDQLVAAGYEIVLYCAAVECGGFDFRFATDTIPAPAMHISLRNFQFLTGIMGSRNAPDQVVTILASASGAAAYLQIIQAGDLGDAPDQFTRNGGQARAEQVTAPPEPVADMPAGRIALTDLDFAPGSDVLGSGTFDTLSRLAERLQDNPELTIALVGHTDTSGPLDVNIAISRARAEAVRQRLITAYEIAPERLTAHGVGYLAPIASNATEDGRTLNRRVEAVLLP